jgi:hypothetical protein
MATSHAQRSTQHFLAGSSMGQLLNPKAAVPLRDYQRANRKLQKELEASAVAARKAAEAAAAQPFKLPSQGKYTYVESRVFGAGGASANGAAAAGSSSSSSGGGSAGACSAPPGASPLKENRPFLKAGEKVARFVPPSPDSPVKPFVRAVLGERKAALPKFSELDAVAPPAVRCARRGAASARALRSARAGP